MMKLLAFLWSGCWHKYEQLSIGVLKGDGAIGRRITYKCSRCGKHKKQDLI